MNTHKLFSTRQRRRILEAVLFAKEPPQVSSLSKRLKISKGLVSQYFGILSREGITRRKGGKIIPWESVQLKALKILLTLDSISLNMKRYPFVLGAGLYGSAARGENTASSDIDLWILTGDVGDEDLSNMTAELKRKNPKISPLYLTRKKIKELKENEKLFYHSIYFGSISLYGERIETGRPHQAHTVHRKRAENEQTHNNGHRKRPQ